MLQNNMLSFNGVWKSHFILLCSAFIISQTSFRSRFFYDRAAEIKLDKFCKNHYDMPNFKLLNLYAYGKFFCLRRALALRTHCA